MMYDRKIRVKCNIQNYTNLNYFTYILIESILMRQITIFPTFITSNVHYYSVSSYLNKFLYVYLTLSFRKRTIDFVLWLIPIISSKFSNDGIFCNISIKNLSNLLQFIPFFLVYDEWDHRNAIVINLCIQKWWIASFRLEDGK